MSETLQDMASAVRRGSVWIVNLDPVIGHEQGGHRPALVVSSDHLHVIPSPLAIVVPITTRDRGLRAHIPIAPPEGGLAHPSLAMTEQPRTISVQRLNRRLGSVADATLAEVVDRLRWFLDL